MDNDFNTAQALGLLFDVDQGAEQGGPGASCPSGPGGCRPAAQGRCHGAGNWPTSWGFSRKIPGSISKPRNSSGSQTIDITVEDIEKMIGDRARAREKKDWAASDAIRDRLMQHGIELNDGAGGTTWDIKL